MSHYNFFEIILFLFLGITTLTCIVLLMILLNQFIRYITKKKTFISSSQAVVLNKEYEPSSSYLTLVPTGNGINIPITNYTPESFHLNLSVDNISVSSECSKNMYHQTNLKDTIDVKIYQNCCHNIFFKKISFYSFEYQGMV